MKKSKKQYEDEPWDLLGESYKSYSPGRSGGLHRTKNGKPPKSHSGVPPVPAAAVKRDARR